MASNKWAFLNLGLLKLKKSGEGTFTPNRGRVLHLAPGAYLLESLVLLRPLVFLLDRVGLVEHEAEHIHTSRRRPRTLVIINPPIGINGTKARTYFAISCTHLIRHPNYQQKKAGPHGPTVEAPPTARTHFVCTSCPHSRHWQAHPNPCSSHSQHMKGPQPVPTETRVSSWWWSVVELRLREVLRLLVHLPVHHCQLRLRERVRILLVQNDQAPPGFVTVLPSRPKTTKHKMLCTLQCLASAMILGSPKGGTNQGMRAK
ncbi:hypothetical protein NL676_025226 [Syzygium grande]|nr:hypothetical protein NL676_025226 [Syzygium grande]